MSFNEHVERITNGVEIVYAIYFNIQILIMALDGGALIDSACLSLCLKHFCSHSEGTDACMFTKIT